MEQDTEAIKQKISELAPWFHYFVVNGVCTKPDGGIYREGRDYPRKQFECLVPHLPDNLNGLRVLDIGCNAGYHSFELEKRGAIVKGIDTEQYTNCIKQANLIKELTDSSVDFSCGSFFDINESDQKFDIILFLGVYYHLTSPELAIPKLSRLLNSGGILFLESATANTCEWYGNNGRVYDSDPTNFLIPSVQHIEKELTENGFAIQSRVSYHRYYVKAVKL